MQNSSPSAARIGLLYGLAAYIWWGIVPIYFKAVNFIPAREVLAHRIVWSAVFLSIILLATGRRRSLVAAFRSRAALKMLLMSTFFVACNWYVFIYSVLSNQIVQGSLGYFILPIVNAAIGTIFFKERMRPAQWIALALAAAGVIVLIVWLKLFPWIALTLAFTFSIYGVIRKHAPVEGTVGLTVESYLLTPIAIGFLLYWNHEHQLEFARLDWKYQALVAASGLVTSIPLICFAQSVQRLRIVTIGFLQYISPTLAFLFAVLIYNESFQPAYQAGFAVIGCGLAIFIGDALRHNWRQRVDQRREAEEEEEKIREMEIMN